MEKNRILNHSLTHSLNHPVYLIRREPKLSLRNKQFLIQRSVLSGNLPLHNRITLRNTCSSCLFCKVVHYIVNLQQRFNLQSSACDDAPVTLPSDAPDTRLDIESPRDSPSAPTAGASLQPGDNLLCCDDRECRERESASSALKTAPL